MSSSKKELLKDIQTVIEHSRKEVEHHRDEIKYQTNFMAALVAMIEKEAPEFREKMAEIQGIYLAILQKETDLVNAEDRAAEDINDIAARFEVIYRISEEASSAQRKVKECRSKIEKLRKDLELDELKGGAKKYKIEADINKAIEAKKKAIDDAEEKLLEFIAAKEKYTEFKVNRLIHAYSHLGDVVSSAMKEQSEEADKLNTAISEAQENIDHLLETEPTPAADAEAEEQPAPEEPPAADPEE